VKRNRVETYSSQIQAKQLPTSGYQQAVGPYFERYGETFSPADPRRSIYIPVKKT